MSLLAAYENVKGQLRAQVQGTCGLYSFYNAVQLLRNIDGTLPTVPSPKKSEGLAGASESLRHYAKRQLQSGQGEIVSEAEMVALVKGWGYRVETCSGQTAGAKQDFITMQTRGGKPVLVAYLAGQDSTGVIPLGAAVTQSGAHWSLVIGTEKSNALVIEPNAPGSLKSWPMATLLGSNAISDTKQFARIWEKTKTEPASSAQPALPKPEARGIAPVADPANWAPSSTIENGYITSSTKTYDLGGKSGTRHTSQKLNHVLVAIRVP